MTILYECGICEHLHPWDFGGDCRDDANRFAGVDEYSERTGVSGNAVEVRTMDDRVAADREIG